MRASSSSEHLQRGDRFVGSVGDEDLLAGAEECSSPSQESLSKGVPQAAASNRRPEGQ